MAGNLTLDGVIHRMKDSSYIAIVLRSNIMYNSTMKMR